MTWSKPFTPLAAGIEIKEFQELTWRLGMHCWDEMSKIHNSLKTGEFEAAPHAVAPAGSEIRLVIPLSEFAPRKREE